MELGLKFQVPSFKLQTPPLSNSKRGLQNPYFDLKNDLQNQHYHVYQLFL